MLTEARRIVHFKYGEGKRRGNSPRRPQRRRAPLGNVAETEVPDEDKAGYCETDPEGDKEKEEVPHLRRPPVAREQNTS